MPHQHTVTDLGAEPPQQCAPKPIRAPHLGEYQRRHCYPERLREEPTAFVIGAAHAALPKTCAIYNLAPTPPVGTDGLGDNLSGIGHPATMFAGKQLSFQSASYRANWRGCRTAGGLTFVETPSEDRRANATVLGQIAVFAIGAITAIQVMNFTATVLSVVCLLLVSAFLLMTHRGVDRVPLVLAILGWIALLASCLVHDVSVLWPKALAPAAFSLYLIGLTAPVRSASCRGSLLRRVGAPHAA
jgi:hypothetical protein